MTLPQFNYDIPFTGEVLPALPGVERELAAVELQTLVAECRRVASESARIIERRRSSDRTMQDSYEITREALELPWIVCMVAVRRMGDSGDERWTETLDELAASWGGSVPVAWQSFSSASNLHLFLREETIAAYLKLTRLDELPPAEFVPMFRDVFVQGSFDTARALAIGKVFWRILDEPVWPKEVMDLFSDPSPAMRIRMSRTPAHLVPPNARDRVIGLLADPDPEVRGAVERQYAGLVPDLGQEMVPALLRFIARDDIDEEARQAADRALRRRGYTPSQTADGLIAVPVKPGLPQRHMNEDLREE